MWEHRVWLHWLLAHSNTDHHGKENTYRRHIWKAGGKESSVQKPRTCLHLLARLHFLRVLQIFQISTLKGTTPSVMHLWGTVHVEILSVAVTVEWWGEFWFFPGAIYQGAIYLGTILVEKVTLYGSACVDAQVPQKVSSSSIVGRGRQEGPYDGWSSLSDWLNINK